MSNVILLTKSKLRMLLLLSAPLLIAFDQRPALACACCAEFGQRNETRAAPEDYERSIIAEFKFGTKAALASGHGEEEAGDFGEPELDQSDNFYGYRMTSISTGNGWRFNFSASGTERGAIELPFPAKLERFEVDTRDSSAPFGAGGPALYKEWRMQGDGQMTGTGGQPTRRANVRLIFHGRGNSCPNATDFTHWTMAVRGDGFSFDLIGDMAK